jgi:hypothetical protein
MQKKNRKIRRIVLTLLNPQFYDHTVFNYYSTINNIDLTFWNIIDSQSSLSGTMEHIKQKNILYIVDIKELNYGEQAQVYRTKLRIVREWLKNHPEEFGVFLEVPEDSFTLVVYKRRISLEDNS